MIYLSNFRTAGKDPRAIAISALVPKWYTGARRKDLAPPISLVRAAKKGEKTMLEYADEYTRIIYSHDLEKLTEELDGHVLLCYCSKKDVCHRFLLGLLLKVETGAEVEEIGGFDGDWPEWFEKSVFPMRICLENEELDKYGLHGKFEDNNIIGQWRELKAIDALELYTN